jgi:RNA polymerase sigma-70 factor, ECF subfamily
MRGPRALTRLADEELMPLAQQGDADAFEILYDRHASSVFSLAFRIVGDRAAAEEISQIAFLSAWRTTGRFDRNRGSVRTWMLSIVRNRAIDALRRDQVHQRRRAPEPPEADELTAPERTDHEAARREEARAVQGSLRELPSDQSRVIELAYYGGFTQSEIAELLEVPLGTVKSRMRRGLDGLRQALEPRVT